LRRRTIQLLSLLAANLPLPFSLRCCPYPFLHCHACPLAIAACPVGVLQHFVILRQVPLYLTGALAAVAVAGGRAACGFLCPFGLFQEWCHAAGRRLGLVEWRPTNGRAWTRWVVLAVLVLAVPALTREPWFCKLCPSGTLVAGVPLVALQPELRALAGAMFGLKVSLLAAVVALAAVVRRPFCRFVCPLGLVLGLANAVAWFRVRADVEACTGCRACHGRCPVDLAVPEQVGSSLCLHCGECAVCPAVRTVRGWPVPRSGRCFPPASR